MPDRVRLSLHVAVGWMVGDGAMLSTYGGQEANLKKKAKPHHLIWCR